jgi:putative membrane protein
MTYTDLPLVNACLNATCTVLLVLGWGHIRAGRKEAHRNSMIAALCTSAAFLACYLYYHWKMQQVHGAAHTKFVDPAWFRPIYLTILLTHLVGAIAIVPLVLMTVSRAFKERFEAHKVIARWTLPIWLYVSVTGVVIYLLLYQIFPQVKGSVQ